MESKKVYPTAEELSKVNTSILCPEKNCVSIFKSESNLNLHLAKTHKKTEYLKKDITLKEYYCPESKCEYHKCKFFKCLKLLKQHYMKVHCEKIYCCDTCNMKFATVAAKNFHMNYCGINFTCCDCEASYRSYESLLTHGRRKSHLIMEKPSYKNMHPLHKSVSATTLNNQLKTMVVRGSNSLNDIGSDSFKYAVMIERSSQTDIYPKMRLKTTQVNQQETQTHNGKRIQLSAETQTIGDYVQKHSRSDSKLESSSSSEDCSERKDNKTQTCPVDSRSKSCNTSFNLEDFKLSYEQSSSSTQTTTVMPSDCELFLIQTEALNPINEFMHSSSQTSFHEDMDTFDSGNYFNCNIETQTDFMNIFDADYTNMCTQTGDDVFNAFNELEYNSSHTQTVFDDVLRSVESQTMMSTQNKLLLSCRDMAHMETQTEEFKQMLEEINA